MQKILEKYLPQNAVEPCFELIKQYGVYLKIVNERQSKHGDYQLLPNGQHKITINSSLNKYAFLITLIHEIAHLVAFLKYGKLIKPHGKEWKLTFKTLMLPFINPKIFPSDVIPLLAIHFQNPTASSDTDAKLSVAIKKYDTKESEDVFLFEIPYGATFTTADGRIFLKKEKKVKRFVCIEVSTGKEYLVQPHTPIKIIY